MNYRLSVTKNKPSIEAYICMTYSLIKRLFGIKPTNTKKNPKREKFIV